MIVTSARRGSTGSARTHGLDHLAFWYHDDRQYLEVVRSFLRPALAERAPILVAVPGSRLPLLRDGLADTGCLVRYEDLSVAGRNPGRIIPGVLLPFAEEHAGRRTWVVGEAVWPWRSRDAYGACMVHEALLNLVLADRDLVVLCAYDARGLPANTVRDTARTHPVVLHHHLHHHLLRLRRRVSRAYSDPAVTASGSSPPLPAPPPHARCLDVLDEQSLVRVRGLVARQAVDAGLPAQTVEAAVLCANELAANTIEHSGGPGVLSVWADDATFVCQLDDAGHITDLLAGRVPPPWDAEGGRGLLLLHELSDLDLVHTGPGRTTVRVHFDLPGGPGGPDGPGGPPMPGGRPTLGE